MYRHSLILMALTLCLPAIAAEKLWDVRQTDIRETCITAQNRAEVCLFKQDGRVWISVLDQSGFDFAKESMIAQIDGTPHPVFRQDSSTRPALVSMTPTDTKAQPAMASFRLRPKDAAFQEALKTGRVLTISTAPAMGPIWKVQVSLDGLVATLDQL